MAWLTQEALEALNFRHLGRNVKISDKASIYDADQMSIGDNSRIDDFCVVSGRVTIGRNVHIAVFCNVAGGEEGIEMCDFSGLAYSCNVFTQSDDYTGRTLTNPTVPDAYKLEAKKAVRIGRHCIAGTSAIIFPGVDMKDGCALGAMAMLTRSTEEWGIYSGVPAKRVRDRKKDLLALEAQYLAE
jgi:galactoside O-acetyltransferase